MKGILAFIIAVVQPVLALSCGSSLHTSTPTIDSLVDGAGASVQKAGTNGVDPSRFTVTFSGPMYDRTVTSPGNITLVCKEKDRSISVARSPSENNSYAITTSDPSSIAGQGCVLTFTSNIKSASNRSIDQASYVFTNAE